MPKIEMKVKPDILRFYINQSEYSIEDLKEKNNLHSVDAWLRGEKNPTFNQLNELSKKLRIPLAYLVVNELHKEEIPLLEYRTVDSVGAEEASRELIDTIKTIKNRQEFVADYRKETGMDPLKYVGIFTLDTQMNEMVNFARELLNIDSFWQKNTGRKEPLKYFREKLSDIGTLVFFNGVVGSSTRRTLNIEEFRAFVLIDEYAPTIFINTNDSQSGQLFSLIHEFAHILFGQDELYNLLDTVAHDVSKLEQKCNEFASEILVPNDVFKKEFLSSTGTMTETITELSNYFKVSKTVIARKALVNNFIELSDYREIAEKNYKEYLEAQKRKKEKKSSGGHYWNTFQYKMDPAFFKTVANSYYEGRTQFTDTLNMLGVNRKGFDILENAYKKGVRK